MMPDAPVIGGYEGRMQDVCERAEQLETQGARRQREAAEARAIAGPEAEEPDEILVADGGKPEPECSEDECPPVDIGDHVEDRGGSDATMVVVRTPLESASDVDAREGKTVAECNPEYPADDDVVVVKFPERTSTDLGPLQGYAFPRSRLEISERIHNRDDDQEAEQ